MRPAKSLYQRLKEEAANKFEPTVNSKNICKLCGGQLLWSMPNGICDSCWSKEKYGGGKHEDSVF